MGLPLSMIAAVPSQRHSRLVPERLVMAGVRCADRFLTVSAWGAISTGTRSTPLLSALPPLVPLPPALPCALPFAAAACAGCEGPAAPAALQVDLWAGHAALWQSLHA